MAKWGFNFGKALSAEYDKRPGRDADFSPQRHSTCRPRTASGGGYRTTKAIAWVINVAPNAWLARCGDQTSNPLTLTSAKSAAMAMAKGACGDYVVSSPIAHLNGLTAILLERE